MGECFPIDGMNQGFTDKAQEAAFVYCVERIIMRLLICIVLYIKSRNFIHANQHELINGNILMIIGGYLIFNGKSRIRCCVDLVEAEIKKAPYGAPSGVKFYLCDYFDSLIF